ncbi:MAG: sulfate ABC transporter substrate-binding protein [Leptospiraceae bacterium]|nr:sulfate ABC transporter substrate-binding protein [Leptospiraceae bacterium]
MVVFLVRKGNPKKIQDWKDLERKDISIISPNPKTSGGGKWNFLAIYGYALDKFQGDKEKSFSYLKEFYSRIPVMDTGSRGAAATFIQRNMGDVLLIWESEAFLALKESSNKNFEIIYPSITIKTTPVISVVNRSNNLKNTSELSNTYLDFLYNETSQRIFAESGFRPIHSNISKEFANKFPVVHFFTAEEKFMNWELIQEEIFEKGKLADGVLK